MVDSKFDKILQSVQPAMKWLDAEKCLEISNCIKAAEDNQTAINPSKLGVYKTIVW
jgi:hypothetical protein